MKISFFTSFKKNDTGIKLYSERLLAAINEVNPALDIQIVALEDTIEAVDSFFARKAYFKNLGRRLNLADVVHIQHEYSIFGLWINPLKNMYKPFRKQITKPVVITVHEIEERKKSKTRLKNFIKVLYYPLLSNYLRYVNQGMFQECQHIIVHTELAKEKLIGRSIDEKKISVIRHGVPFLPESLKSVEEAKRELQVEGKYVITTLGFVTERKGQDLLLSVLDQLPQNVLYLIAGSAPKEKVHQDYLLYLRKFVEEKNLSNRVIFTGYVPEEQVKDIMRATDLFLYTTRQITASGVINDGIAYHQHILTSNLPFVREINEVERCLETFETGDKDDLLKKVKSILQNPKTGEELIAATFRYQHANSYQHAAKETIAIYESLTKN